MDRVGSQVRPLNRTWEAIGWLLLFLFTGLIAIPPEFIFGSYFSQTSVPFGNLPYLTWHKTFLWGLDILTPLVTLGLLWGFERLRGSLSWTVKAYWLGMVAAAVIVGCVAACYFVWQRPIAPTLAEPDFALTCWLFCGTLKSGFAALALFSGLAMAGVAIALKHGLVVGRWVTISLGLTTLPIGLLLLMAGRRSDGAR